MARRYHKDHRYDYKGRTGNFLAFQYFYIYTAFAGPVKFNKKDALPCAKHKVSVFYRDDLAHSQKHGAQVCVCVIIDLIVCIAFILGIRFSHISNMSFRRPRSFSLIIILPVLCRVEITQIPSFIPCSFTTVRTRSVMSMSSVLVVVWISMIFILLSLFN